MWCAGWKVIEVKAIGWPWPASQGWVGAAMGFLLALGLGACSGTGPARQAPVDIACVTDAQLLGSPRALVYVWSPRMVLSASEAHLARAAADAKGLQFVPVVDGRLAQAEWQAALARLQELAPLSAQALARSAPLCAPHLVSQLAYRHFPTGFVVLGGKLHPSPLVGAMPQGFWSEGLRLRLLDFSELP